jgi:hypothetical protein
MFSYDLVYLLLIFILMPLWKYDEYPYMIEIILFSGMMSQIFWLLTSFTNPGFIEKPKDIDFLNLL